MKRFIFLIPLILLFMVNISYAQYSNGSGGDQVEEIVPGSVEDTATASMAIPNVLLENDFNIFFNPAQILNYGTVYGEVWNSDPTVSHRAWGGGTITLPFMGIKLGIFLGRAYQPRSVTFTSTPVQINPNLINLFGFPSPDDSRLQMATLNNTAFAPVTGMNNPPVFPNILPTFDISMLPINRDIDVFLGMKLGSIGIGVKYSHAGNSDSEKYFSPTVGGLAAGDGTIDVKRSIYDHHLTVGAVLGKLFLFSSIDVAIDIGFTGFENTYKEAQFQAANHADIKWKSDNNPGIGIIVRPIMAIGNLRLITSINYNYYDATSKYRDIRDIGGDGIDETDLAGKFKNTQSLYGFNVAAHTKPTDKLKVIYSTGIDLDFTTREAKGMDYTLGGLQTVYDEETDTSKIYIPIGIAVEHFTASWIKFRFGVRKNLILKNTQKTVDDEYAFGSPVWSYRDTQSLASPAPILNKELKVAFGVGIIPAEKFDIDIAFAADIADTFNLTTVFARSLIARLSLKYHY